MEMGRKAETLSFEEAVSEEGRRRVTEAQGGVHRIYSYIERGFYAPQIERLLSLFPRDQVHVIRTDRLWLNTGKTLSEIERFLGVRPMLAKNLRRRYIAPTVPTEFHGMAGSLRAELDRLYKDDIGKTASLTCRDLSDWWRPDYTEPMSA
jgi:hypothetical protein